MSNENSNSKNSPENKKRSWHKEPWYKRLFDKILVSYFLPCKDYCAFCPDFEADVDKVDITVLADRTQRALTTIRCEHAEKCERIYERIQEGRTNETTVVQSSV